MRNGVKNKYTDSHHSVHNIIQKIGYPTKSPDIRDSAALREYYADVNISSTAFFENALSIAKFAIKRECSALGKPTNRDEWAMTADTVNVSGLLPYVHPGHWCNFQSLTSIRRTITQLAMR